MKKIILLILCLFMTSFAFAQPLGHYEYTGNYEVLRQDGLEANYQVEMTKNENDVEICIISPETEYIDKITQEIKQIPAKLKISEPQLVTKMVEVVKEEPLKTEKPVLEQVTVREYVQIDERAWKEVTEKDKIVKQVCYTANPKQRPYLKFGDNSIEIYAQQVYITDSTATNVTIEPDFAHLSINDPNVVAYYPMDNYVMGTVKTTVDYTDNNNDANLTGYIYNTGERINYQNNTNFNLTQYLKINTSSIIVNFSNSVTLYSWFKSSSFYGVSQNYLLRYMAGNNTYVPSYNLYIRNSTGTKQVIARFIFNTTLCDFSGTLSNSNYIIDNQPHLVVGVFNGTNSMLYYDNVLVSTSAVYSTACLDFLKTVNNSYMNYTNGNNTNSLGAYLNGNIYSSGIYNNKALNSSEITEIYNAGKCAVSPIGDKLVAQYILCNQSEMNAEGLPYSETQFSNSTHVFDTNMFVQGRKGKGDIGYNFNGNTTFLKSQVYRLLKNESMSFSFWFKTEIGYSSLIANVYNSTERIVCGYRGTSNNYLECAFYNNSNYFNRASTGYSLLNNTWYYITYVSYGNDTINSNGELYVNTVFTNATGNFGSAGSATLFSIGGLTSGSPYTKGTISDIIIFNKSLSSSEVLQLYNDQYPLYKSQGFINYTLPLYDIATTTLHLVNTTVNKSVESVYVKINNGNSISLVNDILNNYPVQTYTTGNNTYKLMFNTNSYKSMTPLIYTSFNVNNYTCILNLTEGSITNTCPIIISNNGVNKAITSNLTDSINVTTVLNVPCGSVEDGNIETLSYTNSLGVTTTPSYSCNNDEITFTSPVTSGVNTVNIGYYTEYEASSCILGQQEIIAALVFIPIIFLVAIAVTLLSLVMKNNGVISGFTVFISVAVGIMILTIVIVIISGFYSAIC